MKTQHKNQKPLLSSPKGRNLGAQAILFSVFFFLAPSLLKVLPFGKDLGWAVCFSQNISINTTGAPANLSAILDVDAAPGNNKGVLIPRLTTAQMNAIASPATGLLIYNTDCSVFDYYNGTGWIPFPSNASAPATPGAITGTATPVCQASGVAYSISPVTGATSYYWTVPTGATVATGQGTTSITVNFGSTGGNVCVTASNACGTSAPSCIAVTLPGPSAVTATASPNPVCAGSTLSLTGSATGATTWSWSGPNGFTSSVQNPTIASITTAGAGTYTLTASNACGSATATTAIVTVNSVPAQPSAITGTSPVCQGQNGVAYSVTNVVGVTYAWTYSGTGFTCATGCTSNSITANFSATATSGILTVTPSNACGSGTAQTFAITVNAPPTTANAGANQTLACGVTTTTLAGNTPTVGTGAWSVVSGIATITTPSSPTSGVTGLAASGTAVLQWTISNAPCTASTSTMSITKSVGSAPSSPGAISGITKVCNGATGITYSISSVAGATSYTWSVPVSAVITAGQGTTTVTVSWGATSGNVCVTANNVCGSSAPSCTAVRSGTVEITATFWCSDTPDCPTVATCNTNGAGTTCIAGVVGGGTGYFNGLRCPYSVSTAQWCADGCGTCNGGVCITNGGGSNSRSWGTGSMTDYHCYGQQVCKD